MNNHSILKTFRTAALALALTATTQVYAANQIDHIVAVVDSSAILNSDLNQAISAIKQQMQQSGKTPPSDDFLRKDVLEQLILRQAQVEQVKKFGLQADEKALNAAVLQIAKQQGAADLSEFQQKLDGQKAGSYAQLRAQVAEELNINRLRQQQVMSRIKVSDRDIDNFLKSPQGQAAIGAQAHALHVRISPLSEATSPEELQQTAQAVKATLANDNNVDAIGKNLSTDKISVQGADMGSRALSEIPAELSARLAALQVGQTTEVIPAADGLHVLKLLERSADEKKALVPQYFTRHILIQPSEVLSPEDAKQKIDQIYSRLQQGTNFAELAATFSTDAASASDGGSLGWVVPGVMVPAFETVMKETPKGQFSKPFQSQFGWHILTVEDTRQMDMTEDYQRRMAKQILGERQFDTEIDSWLREVRNNAYVDIKDPTLKD